MVEAVDDALGTRMPTSTYASPARAALRIVKQRLGAVVVAAQEEQEEKQTRVAKRQKGADWDVCQTCRRVTGRQLAAGVCLKMGQPGHLVAE